jgi:hypothetical protein
MDRLYLLDNEFRDAEEPGHLFYCRHCMLLNGLLAAFPERAANLEVIRVDHARPREVVIAAVGEGNQSLPLLVLDDDSLPTAAGTQEHDGVRFINDYLPVLAALHARHGFPEPHP